MQLNFHCIFGIVEDHQYHHIVPATAPIICRIKADALLGIRLLAMLYPCQEG
jgi:hypothetical protein